MSDSCIFCKIVRGEIPAEVVERTDDAIAFADLNPMAPTHVLVIPTRHFENLGDFVAGATPHEVGSFFGLAAKIGRQAGGDGRRRAATASFRTKARTEARRSSTSTVTSWPAAAGLAAGLSVAPTSAICHVAGRGSPGMLRYAGCSRMWSEILARRCDAVREGG